MIKLNLAVLLLTILSCSRPNDPISIRDEWAAKKPAVIESPKFVESYTFAPRSTTYEELKKRGISSKEILDIVKSSKSTYRLDRVRAHTKFDIIWENSEKTQLRGVKFTLSARSDLHVDKVGEKWITKLVEHPIDKKKRTFSGTVKSSLWESAAQSGMKPELIIGLTEIFAWQIDFSREVREGDQWRLVVEEKFVNQKSIGWGYILAAQYSQKDDTYTGIRYPPNDPMAAYYQEDGTSLRRMFLKSPMRFGRVSSRFSRRRFHPILKRNRPHLGVDYAAPTGTPVRSVGDGRVVYVGRNGGSGKMIKSKHNSIYTTAYLHLNGYAKKIRRGAKVKQGQTIGYVGSTGLATGPHLHFSFFKRGHYVDPLRIKFPSAKPIKFDEQAKFQVLAEEFMGHLPEWKIADAQQGEDFYSGEI